MNYAVCRVLCYVNGQFLLYVIFRLIFEGKFFLGMMHVGISKFPSDDFAENWVIFPCL